MARSKLTTTRALSKHRALAVYGYARVSTDQQQRDGISLDEQQRRIEGRCLEQGWQLSEMFIEAGVSGSIPFAVRPQGGRLMRLLRSGDIVISPKLDRCFRSSLDVLQTIQELKKRGVGLWLLDLGGDVSGNGISEMIVTILSAVAQFERVRIGERIRDSKRHMRAQGWHQGGTRPFGYRLGPPEGRGKAAMLLPEPAEQEAIAGMIEMRANGESLMAIRDAVRAQGFPISHETVRQCLKRAANHAIIGS
jgi:putative DNA-invertase from lambdoid prophage Rac